MCSQIRLSDTQVAPTGVSTVSQRAWVYASLRGTASFLLPMGDKTNSGRKTLPPPTAKRRKRENISRTIKSVKRGVKERASPAAEAHASKEQ